MRVSGGKSWTLTSLATGLLLTPSLTHCLVLLVTKITYSGVVCKAAKNAAGTKQTNNQRAISDTS